MRGRLNQPPKYEHAMPSLSWHAVARYRRSLLARHNVRTKRGALAFVNHLGFCYAFTAGPADLPGLFDVLATRSIDRMWSWAWQWKDELATEKRLFYGKVLRRKPTYVALSYLPQFFALSGNVGEPDDYLQAYREGRLSVLAKDTYAYLRAHGPCSTWVLRRQFVPRGSSGSAFHRALAALQERFLICKVGEQERGSYSFIWDTFDRWLPGVVRAANRIITVQAGADVLGRYLRTTGASRPSDIAALFEWPPTLLAEARQHLGDQAIELRIDGAPVLAHRELLTWLSARPRRAGRSR